MNQILTLTSLLTRDLEARSAGSTGRALLDLLEDHEVDLMGCDRPLDLALIMRDPSPECRLALEDFLGAVSVSTDLQTIALVALAPDLEHAASRLSRGRPSDDAVGDVLAHACEALVWAHELPSGSRATFVLQHAFSRARAERRNGARRRVQTECLSAATDVPEPLAPYHDEAQRRLDEALNHGVIDAGERDIIDRTRADGRTLRDVAEESVDSYAALQRRRHRAETRIRYYFGVSEVTR